MTKEYTGYLGGLTNQWKSPPAPFNPKFDPKASARYEAVTKSMERDDFYADHTREECKVEWRRRYEELEDDKLINIRFEKV